MMQFWREFSYCDFKVLYKKDYCMCAGNLINASIYTNHISVELEKTLGDVKVSTYNPSSFNLGEA